MAMNSDILPKATLDREYVSSKLRKCALPQRIAQEYYDVSVFPESEDTIAANPDRIRRECRYRCLHREASMLYDEIDRHIYPYAAQDCRDFCKSIHDALPRELRDVIYDFLFEMMQPPTPQNTRISYFEFTAVQSYEELPPTPSLPQTPEEFPEPRPDRRNAHIGDAAFVGERMLHELAQEWSLRSTIIVAKDWQGICRADYCYWTNQPLTEDKTHCIVLQTTYPIARYGQDFSSLERDLAVLREFERPLNILIDWDTKAIVQDKIRNADADMIEYFNNIVELYPLLKAILESENRVKMTFKQYRESFLVERADLQANVLASRIHKARCESYNSYSIPDRQSPETSWLRGSYMYLPQVLHGLC